MRLLGNSQLQPNGQAMTGQVSGVSTDNVADSIEQPSARRQEENDQQPRDHEQGEQLEELQSLLRMAELFLSSPDPRVPRIAPANVANLLPMPDGNGNPSAPTTTANRVVAAIDVVVQLRRIISELTVLDGRPQQRQCPSSCKIPSTVLGRAQRVIRNLEIHLYNADHDPPSAHECHSYSNGGCTDQRRFSERCCARVADPIKSDGSLGKSCKAKDRCFRFRVPHLTGPAAAIPLPNTDNTELSASHQDRRSQIVNFVESTPAAVFRPRHQDNLKCSTTSASTENVTSHHETNNEASDYNLNALPLSRQHSDCSKPNGSRAGGRLSIEGLDNATVVNGPNEILNQAPDCAITSASNSKIIFSDTVAALRIFSLRNSILVIPRVETSVFIQDASNSVVLLGGAQQLRIHGSISLLILMPGVPAIQRPANAIQFNDHFGNGLPLPIVSTPTTPVIENCQRVRFGTLPFEVVLNKLGARNGEVTRQKVVLAVDACKWKPVEKVVDFNWHRVDVASPNWSSLNTIDTLRAITGVSYTDLITCHLSERSGEWNVAEDEPLLLTLQALLSSVM